VKPQTAAYTPSDAERKMLCRVVPLRLTCHVAAICSASETAQRDTTEVRA